MKKLALAATLVTLSFVASANEWRFVPLMTDPSFKLEPSIALTANSVDPIDGPNRSSTGIDFNFNCGLLQDPQNRMRTHINIGSKNEDDVSVNSFELSPRYTVPLGQGLSIGVGPSLAVYRLSGRGYEETLLAGGVAAGINYRSGALFLGADVRFHDTEKKQGTDFDNWTAGVKVGVNF
jgi:hypothetical protein